MSLTPQTITIDLNPSFSQMQTVHCSQYDDNIRQIEVKLKDGGTDIDVSSYTIYIEGTKPDKKGFSYPLNDIGSVDGNTVTFYVQLQMAAVPGMTRMEILLKDGDDHRIGSANFMLAVERAGLQDDTDVSDSELAPYISGAAQQAQAAANSAAAAEQAKDDAIQAKDDAVQAKESAEQSAESISGLSEQIEQNTEDCSDLKSANALLYKNLINEETDSANPLVITDGGDGLPVKDCVVNIQPSQPNDYDSVWVGGAGVNILDPNIKFTAGTYFGLTLTTTDGYHISYSGTATSSGTIQTSHVAVENAIILPAGTYINNAGTISLCKANGQWLANKYSNTVFTVDKPFYVAYIYIEIVSGRTYNNTSNILLAKGSTLPSTWTPYSNICPISGWTEADIHRCGVNQWDEEWEVGGLAGGTGLPYAVSDRIRSKNYCRCTPNTTYWQCNTVSNVYLYVWWYDENKTFISSGGGIHAGQGQTVTSPANAHYFKFSTYGNNFTNYTSGFGLNLPSTDTAYHAYTGTTYSIDLSSAGTVYGGTLDVTTGVLTVDRAVANLGDLTWTKVNGKDETVIRFFSASIKSVIVPPSSGGVALDAICSQYNAVTPNQSYLGTYDSSITTDTSGNLFVNDSQYNSSSASEFKNAMNGVQLVYHLKTPQTYQLTPTEVTTLLKNNTLTANCGTVSLSYYADTKTYIDNAIATAVASL